MGVKELFDVEGEVGVVVDGVVRGVAMVAEVLEDVSGVIGL
jgi:hypothetical protein